MGVVRQILIGSSVISVGLTGAVLGMQLAAFAPCGPGASRNRLSTRANPAAAKRRWCSLYSSYPHRCTMLQFCRAQHDN